MRTARCPSECTTRCQERRRSSFPSRRTAYPCSSAASPRKTRRTWATRRRTSRSTSSRGSYDTTTFSGWGKLSGQKVESLRPGARIAIEERKRHPADFVLWRARKPGEPAWDSPWGKGRPGWHIEDTAITIRHFGPQYDLHGGATELM